MASLRTQRAGVLMLVTGLVFGAGLLLVALVGQPSASAWELEGSDGTAQAEAPAAQEPAEAEDPSELDRVASDQVDEMREDTAPAP